MRPLLLATLLMLATTTQAMDLLETLQRAQLKDPRFAAIKAARDAADITPDIARAALLPQVVASLEVSRNELTQDPIRLGNNLPAIGGDSAYDNTAWGLRVTQPLFDWSAFHQFEAARSQRSRDQAKADEQTQNLTLRIAESYFTVLRASAALELAKSREATLTKKLEEAQAKFAEGVIPQLDVMESETQRDTAYSQRLSAEDALNSSRETLGAAIGQPVDNLAPLRERIVVAPPVPDNAAAWGKLARERNPGLVASRHDLVASESGRTALRSGYLPQVNLFAAHSDSKVSGSDGLSTSLNSGEKDVIGVEARWELFGGGRTAATLKQAELQNEVLRQNLQSAEQSLENQARAQFNTVRTDAARLQANRRNVASAEKSYQAIEAGYEAGTHTITDLMAAETKLHSARNELSNVRYEYIIDSLRLHAAAGLLDQQALLRYNDWLMTAAPAPSAAISPVTP